MAGLDAVLGWLKGTPAAEAPLALGLEKAPQLSSYPSQADADYARNYGFADNNIHEDYLNNNKARVLGGTQRFNVPTQKGTGRSESREMFIPESADGLKSKDIFGKGVDVDLNKNPELQGDLRNTMMSAALAVNRSPIAAMGFDPSRTVMDTQIKNPSVAGIYSPDRDMAYAANVYPDAVVHESTHRGIQKLREKYPEKVDHILGRMPPEEYVVRWLMNSKAGDPENIAGHTAGLEQRQIGIDNFGNPTYPRTGERNSELLKQLEEVAIQDRLTRSRRSGPQ